MTGIAASAPNDIRENPYYARFVVALLTLVYVFNYLDRKILSILAEPVRRELHLSDTQLGIVTGLAFALFYGTVALPIAALADRSRRVTIVATVCAVWSIFTMLCGAVTSFTQLALCRVGVASGEAGASPPSYSIIADYFDPEKRGTALAVYALGVPFGVILGSSLGAWIAHVWGWRWTFVVVGAPGLLLSLAVLLCIREPVRGGKDRGETVADTLSARSFLAKLRIVLGHRTLVLTAVASAATSFIYAGATSFAPAYLMRAKGMAMTDIATAYAAGTGIAGVIGTFGAGWLVDRLGRRDRRAYTLVPAAGMALALPCFAAFIWAGDWRWSVAFLSLFLVGATSYLAPVIALIQNSVPSSERAFTSAVLGLVMTVFGTGLGPLIIGLVSDAAKPTYGDQSLSLGLAALLPMFAVSVAANIAASRVSRRTGIALPKTPLAA